MRLEIGKINITDIRFAEESKIEKGILFINPEDLKPVVLEDEKIKDKALHILKLELEDTVKAHIMRTDGTYDRVDRRGKELVNSQLLFCEEAVKEAKALLPGRDNRTFIPKEPVNAPEE